MVCVTEENSRVKEAEGVSGEREAAAGGRCQEQFYL